MKVNPHAYYVYCFAHQLQLTLVAVAKTHTEVASLFNLTTRVVNVVGASAKRCDILQEKQEAKIVEALKSCEISTRRGINQETSLKRTGYIRWGSHYGTLLSMINMFSYVIDVLDAIIDDGTNSEQRSQENNLLELMLSFDFAFNFHLTKLYWELLTMSLDTPNLTSQFFTLKLV